MRVLFAAVALMPTIIAGCKKPPVEPIQFLPPPQNTADFDRQLAPGELALRKITDPALLPNYGDAYASAKSGGLETAIRNSLHYLAKPSSRKYFPYGDISHERAIESLNAFLAIAQEAQSPSQFDRVVKERFDTYMSVGADDAGRVLFTGYYTPIFNGSATRTERFKYPLYKRPAEIRVNLADPDGAPIGGPWKSRGEIEKTNCLAGQELVWLSDPFEAYVVSVQGSGRIRMPDGSIQEVGYGGNNGHDYKSVAGEMIADDVLTREQLNLDALIAHFKAHPEHVEKYLHRNPRYVFFQPISGGPYGCLNEPVTPMHSIAVDKTIYPRACLAMLSTTLAVRPGGAAGRYSGFFCDQDRGGAIRAAGRCDIFRGTGDDAGKMAGHTFAEGKLYYVFLKGGAAPTSPSNNLTAPITTDAGHAGAGSAAGGGVDDGGAEGMGGS